MLDCKCGGNLIRIAFNCYQCDTCGLKHEIAFASLPTLPIDINIGRPNININVEPTIIINNNTDKEVYQSVIKGLEEAIIYERYKKMK